MSEKLQKVLARAGFGSRREMETWITEGRVKVNKLAAKLGDRVTREDLINVNGRVVANKKLYGVGPRALLYHKDVGTVCTRSDPEKRPTIFDKLPRLFGGRWVAVGRLDISTTGLLLMTTDGELANKLMHPSHEIEREYLVRILGKVTPAMITRLSTGVMLEDGTAKFNSIVDTGGEGANHWYRVTLNEGKNREVRRLWESQDVTVSRLSRIRFGPISIQKSLRRGQSMEMPVDQLESLYKLVGLAVPTSEPESKKRTPIKKHKKSAQKYAKR